MNIKTYILFLTLWLSFFVLKAQENDYVVFKHPNGVISSEGMMKNGIPVGLWKSYYPDGVLKSKGLRTKNGPDSVWNFYDRQGFLEQVISYNKGERNGYSKHYAFADDTTQTHYLKSRILYLNGKRNGMSEYYKHDGSLERAVQYEDGYKHGLEKYYNNEGLLVTIIRYSYDNIVDSENINRRDRHGRKQGIWKTFYPNDRLKTFASYLDGELHGYYREYDIQGKIIENKYFIRGLLQDQNPARVSANDAETAVQLKREFHDNGLIKKEGNYIEDIPVGVHTQYKSDGSLDTHIEFDSLGVKIAQGKFSEEGDRVGEWQYFYADGTIKSQGSYSNGNRSGEWKFYHPNGTLEQKGSYRNANPEGNWIWYYNTGEIRRQGSFRNGNENGEFIEYKRQGEILSKGLYSQGFKQGEWFRVVNGMRFEYTYNYGMKDGTAFHYYPDGTKAFEGEYAGDLPDGLHVYYYPSGKVKLRANYFSGQRAGKWHSYSPLGELLSITEYTNNEKDKIDGIPLRTE